MADYNDLGTETFGAPMYKPSSGPPTRGRGLREQLEAAFAARNNPDVLRAINGDHTPQSVLTGATPMADLTQSPGFVQTIIDRLRGHNGQAPAGPQLDGWRQANRERQAMGEPPISYQDWVKDQAPVGSQ